MPTRQIIMYSVLLIMVLPLFSLIGEGLSGPVIMDMVEPEIIVNYPNGGEELYIGDSADITWSATDYGLAENPITIYYSSNSGFDYSLLSSLEQNDGIYNWQLPSVVSYNNLIKIFAEDDFGNVSADSTDTFFSINYVPPAIPGNLTIDTSNGIDVILNWAVVDTTILGTPIIVDGYIVLYNETAYEDSLQCYYFLAYSTNTSYTHQHVAEFRQQMYYHVVAFKDYRGEMRELLLDITKQNNRNSISKIIWKELKRRFR